MPNTRLADLRTPIGDIESAKAVFARIAELEKTVAVRDAKLELRVAKMKAEHGGELGEIITELNELGAELCAFISANRSLFNAPRKIKTDFGSFGLQTSSEVVVKNEEKFIEWAGVENHLELLKTSVKPDKPAIKSAIESGAKLPGVELRTGDTAVYKVAESIIKAARESAGKD